MGGVWRGMEGLTHPFVAECCSGANEAERHNENLSELHVDVDG